MLRSAGARPVSCYTSARGPAAPTVSRAGAHRPRARRDEGPFGLDAAFPGLVLGARGGQQRQHHHACGRKCHRPSLCCGARWSCMWSFDTRRTCASNIDPDTTDLSREISFRRASYDICAPPPRWPKKAALRSGGGAASHLLNCCSASRYGASRTKSAPAAFVARSGGSSSRGPGTGISHGRRGEEPRAGGAAPSVPGAARRAGRARRAVIADVMFGIVLEPSRRGIRVFREALPGRGASSRSRPKVVQQRQASRSTGASMFTLSDLRSPIRASAMRRSGEDRLSLLCLAITRSPAGRSWTCR